MVERVLGVGSKAVNLNFVNDWLYFGEKGSTVMHRVNPVTREIVTLN